MVKQPYMQKIFFLSFYCFLVKFSEYHRGSDRVKLTKCDNVEWGDKCHYASEILFEWPMSNLLFYCHVILYWEKVTSYEKFF